MTASLFVGDAWGRINYIERRESLVLGILSEESDA
jgi:hypothetical protein